MVSWPRWSRYFYCTTLPSLRKTGWPQLETTLKDHLDSVVRLKKLVSDSGKAFRSTDGPLDKSLRDMLVDMKLDSVKKAGCISNQRASACVAWLLQHSTSGFRGADMAWTGALTELPKLPCFFI